MVNNVQQEWNEKLNKLNSMNPSEKELETLLPILSVLIDNIGSSDAKGNPSIDSLLLNALSTVIKDLGSEKQKIWLGLMILETLHGERKKVDSCQHAYEESHDIPENSINDLEEKRKKKYNDIITYKGVLDSGIKKLVGWFSNYMSENEATFFKRNIKNTSKAEYIEEINQHYQKGNPWTADSDFRANVISKVETYFRGFSIKSCKNYTKKK